tara:strand:- start:494 stop:661 length:168 start_codon:yes stop_codon:yes gene_type:complete
MSGIKQEAASLGERGGNNGERIFWSKIYWTNVTTKEPNRRAKGDGRPNYFALLWK